MNLGICRLVEWRWSDPECYAKANMNLNIVGWPARNVRSSLVNGMNDELYEAHTTQTPKDLESRSTGSHTQENLDDVEDENDNFNSLNDDEEDCCIICLQSITDRTVLLCAHDQFCFHCCIQWTSKSVVWLKPVLQRQQVVWLTTCVYSLWYSAFNPSSPRFRPV